MSRTYQKRPSSAPKTAETPKAAPPDQFGAIPMSALRDALQTPSASLGGHKVDLADAMRAKMENAFGMDFSNLSVYESPMVAAAGANAVADGSTIAFAPGKFDQSGQSGQALLGHELSHIAAQARGEVRGGGFLDNGALEARADREGAQAAAGETVYNGDFAGPSASLAPVAAAPMQADMSPELLAKIADIQANADNYKNYFKGMRELLDSFSPEDLRENKEFQQFILNETSRVSNSEMKDLLKAKKKAGIQATPGDLFSMGFRGTHGDKSFGVFNAMILRMLGGPRALSGVPTGDAAADLTNLTDLIEGDEDVSALLESFSDKAFEGINLSDEQKSTGVMTSMSTIFAPAVITTEESGVDSAEWSPRIQQFIPAQAMAKFNPKLGIRTEQDAGKRFLNTIARRKQEQRERRLAEWGEGKKFGIGRRPKKDN